MDDAAALYVAIAAGVVGVGLLAWLSVLLVRRRRARKRVEPPALIKALDLVPLLVQPIQALAGLFDSRRKVEESLVAEDGTTTLLFSDIEGSTALNVQLGDDRWFRTLEAHDAIVDKLVRRESGTVVKTQGDGFMAAFREPDQAVRCALALGPALASSRGIEVDLRLRVGVHSGEMIGQKGDYFGTNVALAARVAERARGGEVLVTEEVRTRLDGAGDLRFQRRPAVRLKGIPGRHRIHRVTRT